MGGNGRFHKNSVMDIENGKNCRFPIKIPHITVAETPTAVFPTSLFPYLFTVTMIVSSLFIRATNYGE